jgi:hypothetical protein
MAEMAGLSYLELVAAPGDERAPAPGDAVIGHDLAPPPPPPPVVVSAPHRHPSGWVLGLAAGVGAGQARSAFAGPQAAYDTGAAGTGTYTVSLTDGDLFQIGMGLDVLSVAGHTALGAALHTVVFPVGWQRGPAADVNLFLDLGAAGRVGDTPDGAKQGGLFQGTIGVGWESWQAGPLAAGPFLAGTVGHGDENMVMVLLGVGARLYLGDKMKREP